MKIFNDVTALSEARFGSTNQLVEVKGVGKYLIQDSGAGVTVADGNVAVPVVSGTSVNVRQFGAVGDGVTDDTAAVQSALDSGGSAVLLTGEVAITSGLTVPEGVTLFGHNPKSDALVVVGSGYDAVTLGGDYASVTGIGFSSSTERTSGSYISIAGTYRSNNIKNFKMANAFNGITITNEAVITVIDDGEITDCADGAGTGIIIDGGNDTFITNVVMDSTGTEPLCGIRIKHSQAVWITDTDVIDFGTPLLINPDNNDGDVVTWCFFNGLALDTSDGNGIEIAPTNGATVKGLFFDNCWSSTNNRGVHIAPLSSSFVDTVHFTDSTFYNNQLHGAKVDNTNGTINNIEFNNCRASGNSQASSGTYAGFDFGDNLNNFSLQGSFSGAQAGFTVSQSYGISIGSSCDVYRVCGCQFTGNVSGSYADASYGTANNKAVDNNVGFVTEGSGAAAVSGTSTTVTHGLSGAPSSVILTPTNTNPAGVNYWGGNITSTTFTINTDTSLSGVFSWQAEYK